MNRLLKEIRLVMYLFQWVLLLAFFFFYMDTPDWSYQRFTVSLIVSSTYVIILCYALPRRSWFLLGIVDMAISLFFIMQTGKWNSPFMLYAYTTLLWLMMVLRLEQALFLVVVFLLAASLLPDILTFTMILPQTKLNQLRLLLDITIWASVMFWSLSFLRMMKSLYARFFHIYLFLRKLTVLPAVSFSSATEQLIRRVFRTEQAYLCLYTERESDGDWKREYFLHTLLDVGAQKWERFTTVLLDDYTGRTDAYACMPLRLDGEAWGCLLFSMPPKRVMNKIDRLLLGVISTIVCQQGRHNRAHYELAQTLHEEMRKKLAQDMHDGLAQQLFFLSAQLYQLKRSLPAESKEKWSEQMERIEERIRWCHGEVRQTITHLREFREIEQMSEAIEQLLRRTTAGTDLQTRFTSKGRVVEEELPVLDAIYRIVEEATSNAVKHAQAKSLSVSIESSTVQLKIRVKDDGIGFSPEEKATENRYGVLGMKERIAQVGGTLHIRSKPNEGTEILAIIPRKGVEMYG